MDQYLPVCGEICASLSPSGALGSREPQPAAQGAVFANPNPTALRSGRLVRGPGYLRAVAGLL
jgi:hypothetical protein